MKAPKSVKSLEEFGRIRLSASFFMREFLYSEIAATHGILNAPDDPDLAIMAGQNLCHLLLEPLQAHFGRIAIRSAYRSCTVNDFGNKHRLNCASNEANYARHIWDRRDAEGCAGAMACIVIPSFLERYETTKDWRPLAWWIHDHIPYSEMEFFPRLAAFNLSWRERPLRQIYSRAQPHLGWLTKPGMDNHDRSHAQEYAGW